MAPLWQTMDSSSSQTVRGVAVATETQRYHASGATIFPHDPQVLCSHTDYCLSVFFRQPREALLRHAAAADDDPVWTAGACNFVGGGGTQIVLLIPRRLVLLCLLSAMDADVLASAHFCPSLVAHRAAWRANQPKPVFQDVEKEEAEEEK